MFTDLASLVVYKMTFALQDHVIFIMQRPIIFKAGLPQHTLPIQARDRPVCEVKVGHVEFDNRRTTFLQLRLFVD